MQSVILALAISKKEITILAMTATQMGVLRISSVVPYDLVCVEVLLGTLYKHICIRNLFLSFFQGPGFLTFFFYIQKIGPQSDRVGS